MPKIHIEGIEYDTEDLSEKAKRLLVEMQKINSRIKENQNLLAVLNKAKMGYVADLKTEVLSAKAGLFFDDQ